MKKNRLVSGILVLVLILSLVLPVSGVSIAAPDIDGTADSWHDSQPGTSDGVSLDYEDGTIPGMFEGSGEGEDDNTSGTSVDSVVHEPDYAAYANTFAPGYQPLNGNILPRTAGDIYDTLVETVTLRLGENGPEITSSSLVGFRDILWLRLDLIDLSGTALTTIRDGTKAFNIPLPNNLVLDATENKTKTLTVDISNVSYEVGTLNVGSGTAYFEFSTSAGSVLADAGIDSIIMYDFYIELAYNLDSGNLANEKDAELILYPFDGTKTFTVLITDNQPVDPTVEKSGTQDTNGLLNWEVVIHKNGQAQLADVKIADTVGDYHRLVSDSIKVNGAALAGNINVTELADGTFDFTLPGPYTNDIVVTYTTYLTQAAAEHYYSGTNPPSALEVENTVIIDWGVPNKSATYTAAISDAKIPYLVKDWEPVKDTNKIEWTITVETYGQSFDYLHLFDEMDDCLQYVDDSMTLNGTLFDDTDIDFTKLASDNQIKIVLTDSGIVKHSGDSQGKYEFKYETTMTDQDIYNNAFAKDYENKAWLEFGWLNGVGPGTVILPTVEKKAKFVPGMVSKTAVDNYDYTTGIITWNVKVNEDGIEITELTLTDAPYAKGTQKLLNSSSAVCFAHEYVGYVDGSFEVDGVASQDNSNYYFSKNDSAGTVSFKNTSTAAVTYQIQTRVTDGDYIGANISGTTGSPRFWNRINMEGKANLSGQSNVTIKGNADASHRPVNRVLSKTPTTPAANASSAGNYDYGSRKIDWTLTVNEKKNGRSFDDIVVTDTIASGCALFGGVSGVAVSVDGSLVYPGADNLVTYDATTRELKVDFKSSNINLNGKTAVIKYTTRLNDNFAFTDGEFTVKNDAHLTSVHQSRASALSTLRIPSKMLDKSAEAFHMDAGRNDYIIHYTVKINQNQVPFPDNVVLVDTLDGVFDLNLQSVRLYKASISPSGAFSDPGAKINLTGVTLTSANAQTILKVPIPADTEACILEYDVIAYGYNGNRINNSISFKSGVGGNSQISDSNFIDFGQTLHIGASAARLKQLFTNMYYSLKVVKTDHSTHAPLQGATFVLYEFTGANPPSGNSSNIAAANLNEVATLSTDTSGIVTFDYLNKDTVYFLKESKLTGYYADDTYYRVYCSSALPSTQMTELITSLENWPESGNPPPGPVSPNTGLPQTSRPSPRMFILPVSVVLQEPEPETPQEPEPEAPQETETEVSQDSETNGIMPLGYTSFIVNIGIPDVVLGLYDENGEFIQQSVSDQNGDAEFKDVNPGVYAIYEYLSDSNAPGERLFDVVIDEGGNVTAQAIFLENIRFDNNGIISSGKKENPKTDDDSVHTAVCLLIVTFLISTAVAVARILRKRAEIMLKS